MPLLERLHISIIDLTQVDLHIPSSLSKLRKLLLSGKLKELPDLSSFQNLVKLSLASSRLTKNPLIPLGQMPNLLTLFFGSSSYEGETLHFKNGGFLKLKELQFDSLLYLRFISIDSGALQALEKLKILNIFPLKAVPGIQHLKKLQFLEIIHVSAEFHRKIDPNEGEEYFMIKHVPHLRILPFPEKWQPILSLTVAHSLKKAALITFYQRQDSFINTRNLPTRATTTASTSSSQESNI